MGNDLGPVTKAKPQILSLLTKNINHYLATSNYLQQIQKTGAEEEIVKSKECPG